MLDINNMNSDELFNWYVESATEQDLENPIVQLALIKNGFAEILIDSVILLRNKKVIEKLMESNLFDKCQFLIEGEIESIAFSEDNNNTIAIFKFLDNKTCRIYSLFRDIGSISKEIIKKELEPYKSNIKALCCIIDEKLYLDCFIAKENTTLNDKEKIKILKNQANIKNVIIDDNILLLIVTKIKTTIKDMVNVLKYIIYDSKRFNTPITIDFAEKYIQKYLTKQAKEKTDTILLNYIIQTVADYFNIDINNFHLSNQKDIVYARNMIMYLCRKQTIKFRIINSKFKIGKISDFVHLVRKFEENMSVKDKEIVEELLNKIDDFKLTITC